MSPRLPRLCLHGPSLGRDPPFGVKCCVSDHRAPPAQAAAASQALPPAATRAAQLRSRGGPARSIEPPRFADASAALPVALPAAA